MSHHLRVGESRCCDPHTNSRSRDFHSSERGFSKIASTTTSPSTFLPLLVHPTSITHFNHRHLCSSGVACKQVACFRSSLPGACCFLLGKPSVFLISSPSRWMLGRSGETRLISGGSEGRREAQEDPCMHHLHTAYRLETGPSTFAAVRSLGVHH